MLIVIAYMIMLLCYILVVKTAKLKCVKETKAIERKINSSIE